MLSFSCLRFAVSYLSTLYEIKRPNLGFNGCLWLDNREKVCVNFVFISALQQTTLVVGFARGTLAPSLINKTCPKLFSRFGV